MKISTIAYIVLLSSLVACEKNKSLWEISPCGFTSDDELATLRESRSFKIIDSKTFKNIVDTVNVPIHPDSVRLFDSNMNELFIKPSYFVNEWVFGRFFPYTGVPYNDANALLELDKRIFYLSTAYNDLDTINIIFEKCRIIGGLFNNTDTKRPESVPTSASFYFKKEL